MQYRHRQFIANYVLSGGNGVKAVYAAGYQQGYNSACVTASRLLRNAKVKERLEKHAMKAEMKADEVLKELSDVARVDTPIDANQKLKALELLGKFHKLFSERVETVDLTETEKHKSIIANQVQRLRLKLGDTQEFTSAYLQYRTLLSDSTDPEYDERFDWTKNPQNWPDVGPTQAVVADSGSDNN